LLLRLVAVVEAAALGQAAAAVAAAAQALAISLTIPHPTVLAVEAGPRVNGLVVGKDVS
jgi:hypothetical protein